MDRDACLFFHEKVMQVTPRFPKSAIFMHTALGEHWISIVNVSSNFLYLQAIEGKLIEKSEKGAAGSMTLGTWVVRISFYSLLSFFFHGNLVRVVCSVHGGFGFILSILYLGWKDERNSGTRWEEKGTTSYILSIRDIRLIHTDPTVPYINEPSHMHHRRYATCTKVCMPCPRYLKECGTIFGLPWTSI